MNPDEIHVGKSYYPLVPGKAIIYEVDSLIYNNFTKDTDFVHLQFRDEIIDTFFDAEGQLSYRVERTRRFDTTANWQGYLIYQVTPFVNRIEVVENNLRFIKLVFPFSNGQQWKGNIYIPAASSSLDDVKWYYNWDYRMSNLGKPFSTSWLNFNKTAEIGYSRLTNDSTSTLSYNDFTKYREVYADQIGLVYRELTHWEYQPNDMFRNGFSVLMRASKIE